MEGRRWAFIIIYSLSSIIINLISMYDFRLVFENIFKVIR